MELKSNSPSYIVILLHNHTQLHVFREQAPYVSKSFNSLQSTVFISILPLCTTHACKFETNNRSIVVVKSKKQNVSYMNSVILYDYVAFLFVFKILNGEIESKLQGIILLCILVFIILVANIMFLATCQTLYSVTHLIVIMISVVGIIFSPTL